VVPARAWQAAETFGDWTLCGCTVSPGFVFAGFKLAAKDWVAAQLACTDRAMGRW